MRIFLLKNNPFESCSLRDQLTSRYCMLWVVKDWKWHVCTPVLYLFCYLSFLCIIRVFFFFCVCSPNIVVMLRCIVLLTPFCSIVFLFPLLISCKWVSIFYYKIVQSRSKRPTPVETIKRKTMCMISVYLNIFLFLICQKIIYLNQSYSWPPNQSVTWSCSWPRPLFFLNDYETFACQGVAGSPSRTKSLQYWYSKEPSIMPLDIKVLQDHIPPNK